MLADLGLPDGHVVSKDRGGEEVLRRVLDNVRKFAFSGYLKIELSQEGDASEGIVSFTSGEPGIALYAYSKSGTGGERIYRGAKAAEFIWEDSLYSEATVSLHSRAVLADLEKRFPDARLGRVELMPPPTLPSPLAGAELSRLEGKKDQSAQHILEWAKQGYNVSHLVRLYLTDPSASARSLPYFEANIQRLRSLEEVLRLLDIQGYEREGKSLSRRMKDPERLLEAEGELEKLRRRIEGLGAGSAEEEIRQELEQKRAEERIDSVYDLILKYHRHQVGAAEPDACARCGGALDAEGKCPSCDLIPKTGGYGRPLNPRFSFESFVTGPGSKFAEAAARAVANEPGKAYNPLFIYSRSGMGKTHLVQAVGNFASKQGKSIVYAPTEVLETELVSAVSENRLDQLHKAYRGTDLLILDDVQFLAGKERIQEELFLTFNSLLEKGGQVVLAADRQPKEIPGVSERLITRFESGLIVDLQPPDLETRLAILERRTQAENLSVPRDVLAFVAEVCKDNVRQLEGGLNRVVAFSSLMRAPISIALAQEILHHEERAVKVPKANLDLLPGKSYLVEEQKPDLAHRLLISKAREGYHALAIVRSHPRSLKQRLGSAKAEVYWLTDKESKDERTLAPSLERTMVMIEEALIPGQKTLVMLDDVQYLISNTTFDGVIRFIRTLVDEIAEREAIFILSVDPEGLTSQELSILEREMEVMRI